MQTEVWFLSPLDRYQSSKYFGANDEEAMGTALIDDGGTIKNDQIGVELPSTGGMGTKGG